MEIAPHCFYTVDSDFLLYFANHALVFVTVQENICQHVKGFGVVPSG